MLRIKLRYPDVDTFVGKFATNLSRGGMFIASRKPKPVGSQVRFELQLADGSAVVTGEGVVRWVRPFDEKNPRQPHGMGIEFTRLSDDSAAAIDRVVALRRQRGMDADAIPMQQPRSTPNRSPAPAATPAPARGEASERAADRRTPAEPPARAPGDSNDPAPGARAGATEGRPAGEAAVGDARAAAAGGAAVTATLHLADTDRALAAILELDDRAVERAVVRARALADTASDDDGALAAIVRPNGGRDRRRGTSRPRAGRRDTPPDRRPGNGSAVADRATGGASRAVRRDGSDAAAGSDGEADPDGAPDAGAEAACLGGAASAQATAAPSAARGSPAQSADGDAPGATRSPCGARLAPAPAVGRAPAADAPAVVEPLAEPADPAPDATAAPNREPPLPRARSRPPAVGFDTADVTAIDPAPAGPFADGSSPGRPRAPDAAGEGEAAASPAAGDEQTVVHASFADSGPIAFDVEVTPLPPPVPAEAQADELTPRPAPVGAQQDASAASATPDDDDVLSHELEADALDADDLLAAGLDDLPSGQHIATDADGFAETTTTVREPRDDGASTAAVDAAIDSLIDSAATLDVAQDVLADASDDLAIDTDGVQADVQRDASSADGADAGADDGAEGDGAGKKKGFFKRIFGKSG